MRKEKYLRGETKSSLEPCQWESPYFIASVLTAAFAINGNECFNTLLSIPPNITRDSCCIPTFLFK